MDRQFLFSILVALIMIFNAIFCKIRRNYSNETVLDKNQGTSPLKRLKKIRGTTPTDCRERHRSDGAPSGDLRVKHTKGFGEKTEGCFTRYDASARRAMRPWIALPSLCHE
jgi:hypothetical protein